MSIGYLRPLFAPRSVAVFGASDRPGSVGARVFANLVGGTFAGPIHAINPAHPKVAGRACHRDLEAVGGPVDLAIIATPADTVPDILQQCGEHGVGAAVVLSAGFGETVGGAVGGTAARAGRKRRDELVRIARRYRMRLIGPNCLGVLLPHLGINATFGNNDALPGSLAFLSQSGALCTSILDWAEDRKLGFSAVVSLGDAADLDFGDLLDYFALDPTTHGILLYIEGLNDARRFLSGLRAAARLKPVVVLKSGRHPGGSQAARSHTAAMVGGDQAFDAALRRAGVVRATTLEHLFAAAELLASRHRANGKRLAVISNGGGLGVIAADRVSDVDLELATLAPATIQQLDAHLPAHWSRGNPVDLIGDAPPVRFQQAVAACLADPGVDGVVAMLAPQAMTEPDAAAAAVIAATTEHPGKPVLACWMGGRQVEAARARLTAARIPSYLSPEAAVEAFAYLARHHEHQQLLLQVPGPRPAAVAADIEGAHLIVDAALGERRTLLGTAESKALLAAFRIPVTLPIPARSANEALVAAESIGFPVAMKINSPDITHKSDVGGIRLDLTQAGEIRAAYAAMLAAARAARPDARIDGVTVERMAKLHHGRELLVGVTRDPVFGPVISFGAGGTATEILADVTVALPPINTFIAADLVRRTRAAALLTTHRGHPPAALGPIYQTLIRVSEMVCEFPEIRELDINPLLADPQGVLAVDARIVLAPLHDTHRRYGHLAIHPYPAELEQTWQTADGTDVVIRPIRPEDADIEQTFVRRLSGQSRYFRFMQALNELTPRMLVRFTQIDYDREMAFIAVIRDGDAEIQIGVVRYVASPSFESCEFALVVADDWHGRGLGTRLMRQLMAAAQSRGLRRMTGEVLASNHDMLQLADNLGFQVETVADDPTLRHVSRDL